MAMLDPAEYLPAVGRVVHVITCDPCSERVRELAELGHPVMSDRFGELLREIQACLTSQ